MNRLINRIKGFDIKRMIRMIKVISKRSGHSFLHVFLDIFRCFIKYGSGYMDYYLFYFENMPDKIKATYINAFVNKQYIRACNDPKYFHVLSNKVEFLNRYKSFIKRDFIDLNKADYNKFLKFYNAHDEFMAKPIDGLCGKGIDLIISKEHDPKELYQKLIDNKQLLLEERIKQNDKLNELYPNSINTIRIVTLNKDNNVRILFQALRIGNNGKVVDNFNNGGLFTVIDNDGTISKPALDKQNNVYEYHPYTNTPIIGFKIPRFKDVQELCKKLALVTPELGICGWDIAISQDGIDVVEGNEIPGYDIYQCKEHLAPSIEGLKKKFDDAIFPEKKEKKVFAKGYCILKFIYIFFVGIVLDYLADLFGFQIDGCLLYGLLYIFLYKHIDTRSFKKTILYLTIIFVVLFCYYYLIQNFVNDTNLDGSLLYYATSFPKETVLLLIKYFLIVFVFGLFSLYFVFPFIDKMVEKLPPIAGFVIAIPLGVLDLMFITTIAVVVVEAIRFMLFT